MKTCKSCEWWTWIKSFKWGFDTSIYGCIKHSQSPQPEPPRTAGEQQKEKEL